ncbi:MAG: CHAD domain-containing protein [Bauldia sp.]
MSHGIGKDEDVGAALARLVEHDLVAARVTLGGIGAAEGRIHRTRQKLKRVRSLLKVLEPVCADTTVAAKKKVSDAARLLSGARDADAAAASARGLRQSVPGRDPALDRLVASLDRDARAHHTRAPAMAAAAALIAEAEELVHALPDGVDGTALLERALVHAYRRGAKSLARAERSLAVSDLHRWRKHVKHLWHLIRLARKRLPGDTERFAARLEDLAERLGLDHDHAILAAKLAESPTGEPALSRQFRLIAERRRRLEAEAFALGERLYAKNAKRFRRRLRVD